MLTQVVIPGLGQVTLESIDRKSEPGFAKIHFSLDGVSKQNRQKLVQIARGFDRVTDRPSHGNAELEIPFRTHGLNRNSLSKIINQFVDDYLTVVTSKFEPALKPAAQPKSPKEAVRSVRPPKDAYHNRFTRSLTTTLTK